MLASFNCRLMVVVEKYAGNLFEMLLFVVVAWEEYFFTMACGMSVRIFSDFEQMR